MKRNTKDELRYPVKLNDREWYYVEGRYINIYRQVPGYQFPINIKIPRKTLERLLAIK